MSAQHIPKLFTVEEFEQITNPPGGRYELHHGELVFVTWPLWLHKERQRRLRKSLESAAEPLGYIVDVEYPYSPLPESEAWGADVVCVSARRDYGLSRWLMGSPELVIEIKSPSNSDHELLDKAMTTLAGDGAVEFWIVDPKAKTAKVYSKTNGVRIYRAPDEVPVAFLKAGISLDRLFADL